MSNHDTSLKLKIVRQFLDQGVGIKKLGIEHRLAHSMIGRWIASYQLHGLAGLEPKYSAYDATFRLNVLRRKCLEDLSSNQVAAIFGIRHPGCINRWENVSIMKVEWRRWCPALEDVPPWRSKKFPPSPIRRCLMLLDPRKIYSGSWNTCERRTPT